MKKILIVVLVVVFSIVVLSLAKDQLIKSVISTVATGVTGAKVEIKGFSLGILSQSVSITGFRMYNPEGFPKGVLVDLPKIAVDYDAGALLKGRLHLKKLEIDLKEVNLTKNKDGKLNVDSLKVAQKEAGSKEAKPKAKKSSGPMEMKIDLLNLNIGRMVMTDYASGGAEPTVQVYDINIKGTYNNITSPQQLAALILTEPMKRAGIKGAAIYGAAMLTGVGIVPVAIAAAFGEKDSVQEDIDKPVSELYDAALALLKNRGKVAGEDKTMGVITASVDGASVSVKLKSVSDNKTSITVSARKMLLPKPEIAKGILYQIKEGLK
ncbi:MAG: AsmA family protein [Candidatus Omnitrophota bacterium]